MTIDLAFDVVGEGPPLLILHGMFGSATNWRSFAQRLAGEARVYCVDLRNHGRSPWADAMGFVEMAEDLRRLIESQGIGRPALMGHSMGGKVAMAFALLWPEALERLVVVDIAPVTYRDRMSGYIDAMRGIDLLHSASRAEVRRALSATIPEAGVVAFLMQNLVQRDAHFDWRINLQAIAASMPRLSSFPPELLERRHEGPAAAIAGADSSYLEPADTSVFQPMFPNISLELIPRAGHWVHADKPEEFLAAARRALGFGPASAG